MIISASRRTDIPAFYSEWLLKRLAAGSALTPHPRNAARLGRARLSPDNVDALVFWTKNPEPMLDKLDALDALGYRYYFSFTVTAYGPELEKFLPPKEEVVTTFQRLADRLGPKRVDWRFDPIAVDAARPVQWHLDRFGALCRRLGGYTERCIVNFVKSYARLSARVQEMDERLIREMAPKLAAVAAEHHIPLFSCTGKRDLRSLGLNHGSCIDRGKIEAIIGWPIKAKKDPGQPAICRCIESVDIGVYDTCAHGCVYCYATVSEARARRRLAAHDPAAPMLTGAPKGTEIISDRTKPSQKEAQGRLYGPPEAP
ncbi:MAG: DUF1848 domain-containing protein [Candidatus Adiutrix sp.]|jgi:hypothetical protein|nr:DUF1848 domain-containing protein [Candidatus Adiutrix sp.]